MLRPSVTISEIRAISYGCGWKCEKKPQALKKKVNVLPKDTILFGKDVPR